MELKRAIKEAAKGLGFTLVGVTTPDPPAHFAAYESWIDAGYHAGMAYLASDTARIRRAEPRQILAECQSILLLATPYFPPGRLKDTPGTGRVAAYAWGDDYHEVLPIRLRQLVSFIEAQVGSSIPNRCYADTGPVLERDLAQRAGLGWVGKNTCLIHPRLGSYFFLSEILLGIELEPDEPFTADHCGTCTRCIDACPTGCLLPGRVLDAGSCISYLTIELKEDLPPKLRPRLGVWSFGCDICQQVCPWNRFAPPMGDPAFAPREGLPHPDLQEELQLDDQQFRQKFKHSAVKRAKRRGYLRNVAVALGNSGSAEAIDVLRRVLINEPQALIRGHAAWALGQIGSTDSRRALESALEIETDNQVIKEIQEALKIV